MCTHPTLAAIDAATIPNSLTLTGNNHSEIIPATTLHQWYTTRTITILQPDYRQEIEKSTWCPVWNIFLCDLILTRTNQAHLALKPQTMLNESALKDTLQQIAPTFSIAPVEPKFAFQDGKVVDFATGQDGQALDIDASEAAIRNALAQSTSHTPLTLPAIIQPIKASAEGIEGNDLGITTLLSEGRTGFAGSPKNRIHNFTLGAQQFNGLIIKPGEEFSFVDHLGPVDGEHGYLPELVIKQNQTTPEFGGGICQVSTTAFRAALNAGLKVTMRRNHAYAVSYYKPYGMDATVYIPRPDLRFINNTPASILIQTAVEGQELVFRFYGTPDGRKTAIDGPHILDRSPDGSMKTVFTQTVVDASGNTLINDKFNSTYQSPSLFPHPGQEVATTTKKSH